MDIFQLIINNRGGGYGGGGATGSCQIGGGGGSFVISTAVNLMTSDGLYQGSSTWNSLSIPSLGYNSQTNYQSTFGPSGYITITKL